MSDLLSAMVAASKDFAEPLAAAYASGNRPFTVQLRRPGAPGTFNRDTGKFDQRASVVFYTGPARIFPSNETEREVGDEEIPFNATTITIDYLTPANSAHPDWTPRVDDIVEVVDDAQARDVHLPNRVFEVTGVSVGGHFGTGWTLQTFGAAPSRQSP